MREIFRLLILVTFVGCVGMVEAQQPKKVPQIGFTTNPASLGVFRQALRDLGYVEGKNITFEYPKAEGNFTRPRARPNSCVSR